MIAAVADDGFGLKVAGGLAVLAGLVLVVYVVKTATEGPAVAAPVARVQVALPPPAATRHAPPTDRPELVKSPSGAVYTKRGHWPVVAAPVPAPAPIVTPADMGSEATSIGKIALEDLAGAVLAGLILA